MKHDTEVKPPLIPEHYMDSLVFSLVNLIGSLMPVWGGILLLEVFAKLTDPSIFVNDGQFYIYSAALYTPSCYLLYKNKRSTFDFYSFLFGVSGLMLIVCTLMFAGIYANFVVSGQPLDNSQFIRTTSLGLFVMSCVVLFLSQALQNKIAPNLTEERRKALHALEEDFDHLGEKVQ